MGWPTTFANLPGGSAALSLFDTMFAQVAQMVAIPCTVSGTNTLTLQPIGNAPLPANYQNFTSAKFIAQNTSTGPVTAQIGTLPSLKCFLADGATQITSQITAGEEYVVVFSQSLGAPNGGFFLENASLTPPAGGGGGTVIPSGTVMLFQQTAAPTGFTKLVVLNDYGIRIVSGAASSTSGTAFSTVFAQTATGATTIATGTMPSHQHSQDPNTATNGNGLAGIGTACPASNILGLGGTTQAQGGGGSHTHAVSLALAYVDCILASKN